MYLLPIVKGLWAGFGVYWMAAARGGKAAATGEWRPYRFVRWLVLVVAFTLLFWERTGVGLLGRRFAGQIPSIASIGFAVTLAGLALALWARVHLGQYWSDKVILKVDHQLIRSGPYACLRHPIYSGVLLGVAGTVLLIGEWRGVLAFALLFTNWTIKAKKEERILSAQSGDQFQEHMRRAGFLFPRFRSR